jgi:hypothetical protein
MSVSAVMPVHEEVSERTKKQQHIWKRAQDVGAMLLPQEERGDRGKDAESKG